MKGIKGGAIALSFYFVLTLRFFNYHYSVTITVVDTGRLITRGGYQIFH